MQTSAAIRGYAPDRGVCGFNRSKANDLARDTCGLGEGGKSLESFLSPQADALILGRLHRQLSDLNAQAGRSAP
jgi:hypothetical protein